MTRIAPKCYKNSRPPVQGGAITDAESKQLRHNVFGALAAYRERIEGGVADWHDFHQTGVLLSEIAESLWYVRANPRWRKLYADSLSGARRSFKKALECLPPGQEGELCKLEVLCDLQRSRTRAARLGDTSDLARSHSIFHHIIRDLDKLQSEASEDLAPRVRHQLAIAHRLIIETGDCPNGTDHFGIALRLFAVEKPADRQAAYRGLFLTQALLADAQGNKQQRRAHAFLAEQSARRNGDYGHWLRSLFISWFGQQGERMWRAARDGLAISKM
ncbi:MAG TPA: hypothetical protein VLG40_04100 [Candidatus Saccharimonas sp.]|nr:hypothetical protein [Candidatus Saccharimonas sp.]